MHRRTNSLIEVCSLHASSDANMVRVHPAVSPQARYRLAKQTRWTISM